MGIMVACNRMNNKWYLLKVTEERTANLEVLNYYFFSIKEIEVCFFYIEVIELSKFFIKGIELLDFSLKVIKTFSIFY